MQLLKSISSSCWEFLKSKNMRSTLICLLWWEKNKRESLNYIKEFTGLNGKCCLPKSKGSMGFRELEKFNEAMLAKQIWRLVHDTDSLFYKVFKAKYFPSGNVFEAKVNSSSFTWKSILKARKVIAMGAKWRVGNGSLI